MRAMRSLRNPQEHGQATLNLHQYIRIDASEGWPYLIALNGPGELRGKDAERFLKGRGL